MEPGELEALNALLEARVVAELREGGREVYGKKRREGADHRAALLAVATAFGLSENDIAEYLEPQDEEPAEEDAALGARTYKEAKARKRRAALRHRDRQRAERGQAGPGMAGGAKASIAAIVLGLAVALYFGAMYDTTVEVPSNVLGVKRVHNEGRMNTRTVGCVVGVGFAVVGGLLFVVSSRAKKQQ